MSDGTLSTETPGTATEAVSSNGRQDGASGTILQITGPVVDVQFPPDRLPEIYNALEITRDDGSILTLETQSHLGNDAVRAIAMSSTDGLRRGTAVLDIGAPITVPVGPETLGRILNVVGQPIDEAGPVIAKTHYPIHRPAPPNTPVLPPRVKGAIRSITLMPVSSSSTDGDNSSNFGAG